MANFKCFNVGFLETNCYVVYSETSNVAILIDVGGGYKRIKDFLESINKTPTGVLLTHGHFDHLIDIIKWQNEGVKVYVHKDDEEFLNSSDKRVKQVGLFLGESNPDFLVDNDEVLKFADDIEFRVIHTPGHSKGSVCYLLNEKYLFAGDTVFYKSYGRTDLHGGDYQTIVKSIKKLLASLDEDVIILPGHGEFSTVKIEREYNPTV